jgi:hypothetical protein
MQEENVVQTEVQAEPKTHVSLSDDGIILLSPEAEAAMSGVEPPVLDKVEPEQAQPPVIEKTEPEVAKRKIKWQGQEVEIDPTKEEEFLSKGYDYTQKTQQLAAERNSLAPYVGLIDAVKQDPGLSKHIAEYLKGTPKEEPKQFDDPIEQLKQEMRTEILKDVEEKYVKPFQQQANYQQVVDNTKARVSSDPLYKDVHQVIMQDCLDHGFNPESLDQSGRVARPDLSDPVGLQMYVQLDRDPSAYLKTYNRVREKIAQKPPVEKAQEVSTEKPVAVKRETKAPFLESSGGGTQPGATAKQAEKIKELTKRSRNGDFKATGELLELMS